MLPHASNLRKFYHKIMLINLRIIQVTKKKTYNFLFEFPNYFSFGAVIKLPEYHPQASPGGYKVKSINK